MILTLIRRICVLIAMAVQSSFLLLWPAHAASYVFNYVALSNSGVGKVVSVNPSTNAESELQMQFFPKTTRTFVYYPEWISPTGKWMLLQYYTSTPGYAALAIGAVRLINLQSGEIREIASGSVSVAMGGDSRPDQVAAWSPDGRLLAFSIPVYNPTDYTLSKIDAYLYDVGLKTTLKINTHQGKSLRFAWAPDSSRLAVEGESTDLVSNYFATSIDIVNIKANMVEQTIPNLGQSYVDDLCNLEWSPDERYLAYVSGCNNQLFGDSEIYVWDLKTKMSIQTTSLARSMLAQNIPISPDYNLYWLSPNQLLIGLYIIGQHAGYSSIITQTIIYDTSKASSTLYYMGQVTRLSISPDYRNVVMSEVASYNADFSASSTQVRLGNLDQDVATSGTVLPDGGAFTWSPDGKFMEYQQAVTGKFTFVDVSTDKPNISYTFDNSAISASLSTPDAGIIVGPAILPIGWWSDN